ncbi:VanZ family protein [Zobellia amurskyensis]|nr:VanZ family protein [Zobellia amurskyensis]
MNSFVETKKVKIIITILFIVGVSAILFLSWKTNPNLKELPFIPEWLSDWTDQVRNNRRRTAVPFIGLGLLTGFYLISIKRTTLSFWIYVWAILFIIVCLAEAGQYFLPSRSLDLKDVIWGVIGSTVGLAVTFTGLYAVRLLKK